MVEAVSTVSGDKTKTLCCSLIMKVIASVDDFIKLVVKVYCLLMF